MFDDFIGIIFIFFKELLRQPCFACMGCPSDEYNHIRLVIRCEILIWGRIKTLIYAPHSIDMTTGQQLPADIQPSYLSRR